jgi:hypothetical protein
MGMGGTGGAKSKGKRRTMSEAPKKRTRSPESIAKAKVTRAKNKKAAKKAGGWISTDGKASTRYGQGFDLEG